MKRVVTLSIKGIKCDNTQCGYHDMEADFDPDEYLNAPCPECGSNLLTQADYDIVTALLKGEQVMNQKFADIKIDEDAPYLSAEIRLNGIGRLEFGELKPEASISGKEEM